MSWIEELGEKEITTKHAELFVGLVELAAEQDLRKESSVKETLNGYIDTAITNLEKIRKANNGEQSTKSST